LSSNLLVRALAHPLTAGLAIDDPATTERRREIIASKPLLREIYDEWYRMLADGLPSGDGPVLELGSGAGYCERFIPGLITSEIFYCSSAQLAVDAQQLPFADNSLRAVVFTDVLHHIPDAARFLSEASRCLRPGGRILMVEPWVTSWSSFVYRHFHHEPFRPEAPEWTFPARGPLSGANGAIPWIVFVRDRQRFEREYTHLKIERIRPFLPFRYLLSGGVGSRSLMPAFTASLWTSLEKLLQPLNSHLGMFAFVAITKH
jgi:SAM-dependent methyltransferase